MQDSAPIPAPAFADGPLTGVRVLDLTGVIMGPFATHILADLGADVIKVEPPEGDFVRNYPPLRHDGMSGMVFNLHRNKRSVLLDLKQPAGAAALRKLIARADVLVHNMRPKTIQRLGFDYQSVRSINPGIIYCSGCGFGSGGPYADKAAYDDLIQAACGLAALGERMNGEPSYAPTLLCDKLAGQTIAWAISAALYQRAMTGQGQEVEVPMLETAIEFMLVEHFCGGAFVPPLGDVGFQRVLSRFRKPFATRDGHACIMPHSKQNWDAFFDFIGAPGCKDDPEYSTYAGRARNVEMLYGLIEREAAKRTTAQWVAYCDDIGIPCMPVIDLRDIQDDPHVRSVDLFQDGEHPSEGTYRVVRSPVRFGASSFRVRRHAPRAGEHTEEVLREAGLTADEIEVVRGSVGG